MPDTQTRGRIKSVDDLDKCMRVTNASAWMVLVIATLLLVVLGIWSVTAVIPSIVSVTGVMSDGKVRCWVDVDTAQELKDVEATATIGEDWTSGVQISPTARSKAEIVPTLGSDYVAGAVNLGDWNYEVTIEAPKDAISKDSRLVPVRITIAEQHPIDLVFASQSWAA